MVTVTRDEVPCLCTSMPGAVEDYPFGDEVAVFKVGRKMFALASGTSIAYGCSCWMPTGTYSGPGPDAASAETRAARTSVSGAASEKRARSEEACNGTDCSAVSMSRKVEGRT